MSANKTARLWAVHNRSDRHFTLTGASAIDRVTSSTGFASTGSDTYYADVFDITDARTYTLSNSENIGLICLILKIDDAAPAKTYTVTAAVNNASYGSAVAGASSLDKDETTTITASPKTGYEFTSWAVSGTGATLSSTTTNPTTLTMGTANATVTATFTAINYTITHLAAENGAYTIKVGDGSAVSTNTTANYGQTITLAATPNDGYVLTAWNVTAGGDEVSVTENTFTMPAANVMIAGFISETS